jgi:hypothetical protein
MSEKRQLIETLDLVINSALSNLHTATIAKVVAVGAKTIDVKPVINKLVDNVSIESTTFTKVPPLFLQGGASYTAHPISVGDYCLLILTERCFDRWYEGQDFRLPAEFRMHDYSDGIAIVGVNTRAGAITIPSVIQQTGDTNQDGNYTHQGTRVQTGNCTINGDLIVDGDITCTGRITCANATIAGIDFATHIHSGIEPGGGNSGGPS